MSLPKRLRSGLVAACAILAMSSAQAELQTWRLAGTADPDSSTPGAGGIWADEPVFVDFVLETNTPYNALFGDFSDLVRSVSFNGGTAVAPISSYLLQLYGAAFLNAQMPSSHPQGLAFVSFGHPDDMPQSSDVGTVLSLLSAQVRNRDEFTLSFGSSSVLYVIPSSFTQVTSVPEPDSLPLALLGIGLVGALSGLNRRQRTCAASATLAATGLEKA
jgi:PEP-CTERM motif